MWGARAKPSNRSSWASRCASALERGAARVLPPACRVRPRKRPEAHNVAPQERSGKRLPRYVENEFRRYLECGVHAHGFARAVCETCGDELLLPFACKLRGICPSCNTRRMTRTAAHLIDHVIAPDVTLRQWVLTVPKKSSMPEQLVSAGTAATLFVGLIIGAAYVRYTWGALARAVRTRDELDGGQDRYQHSLIGAAIAVFGSALAIGIFGVGPDLLYLGPILALSSAIAVARCLRSEFVDE